jgi:chromosome partitioning protein
MRMGKVIAFSNQKGGVGKTTTAINLASYVAKLDRTVLIIDFDPQGNTTSGFGIEKNNLSHTVYDLISGECSLDEVVVTTEHKGLHIIPSNIDLAAAEIDLVTTPKREYVLKNVIAPLKNLYDYIFIDCPPSLGLITLNALTACDSVLIPIQSEFFALEGLSQLMNTIKIVKQRLNPDININGVILTMYDNRSVMSKQVTEEIQKYFGEKVYSVPVPRNIKLVEAPSFGIPVSEHAPHSSGAVAYEMLAKDYIAREEKL